MGAGGATWDTAGTFDVGGNTFDPADATEHDGSGNGGLAWHAWWTVTPDADARITAQLSPTGIEARVYTGATYASRVFVAPYDYADDGLSPIWNADAGVTYHLLVGVFSDPPALYTVNRSQREFVLSPWFDDLQDAADNHLIVTHGDRRLDNPNPAYEGPENSRPEWMENVIRGGQARSGDYLAQEVLGGDDVYGAIGCVIAHASVGHEGGQSWNESGGGADPTPPVCVDVPTGGDAEPHGSTGSTSFAVDNDPSFGLISGTSSASFGGPSWGIWYLPVRDNLPPYGVLTEVSEASPTAQGYPSDAEVIWEADYPDLLGIELADGDPVPTSTDYSNLWALHDPVAPVWSDGSTGPWHMGPVGIPPTEEDPNRPYLLFVYTSDEFEETDGEWHELPNSEGWDGHEWTEAYDFEPGEAPDSSDGMIVAWPTGTATAVGYGESIAQSRPARIAVKFILKAQRFRFRYIPDATASPAPRRVIGRPHPARVWGDNTVQNGRRVIGGIL
jgi:hypothetical protein